VQERGIEYHSVCSMKEKWGDNWSEEEGPTDNKEPNRRNPTRRRRKIRGREGKFRRQVRSL